MWYPFFIRKLQILPTSWKGNSTYLWVTPHFPPDLLAKCTWLSLFVHLHHFLGLWPSLDLGQLLKPPLLRHVCDNVSKAFSAMPLPLSGPIPDFLYNRGWEQQSCLKAGTRWFILVRCLPRKHIAFIYMFYWLEVVLGRLLESVKGLKALTILSQISKSSKYFKVCWNLSDPFIVIQEI